jgi:hypothetical protein
MKHRERARREQLHVGAGEIDRVEISLGLRLRISSSDIGGGVP